MFGKIPGVNANVVKTYKATQKSNITMHTDEIVVSETYKKQTEESSRMNAIMHKLHYGMEVSYDDYVYVLTVDNELAILIKEYREFRSRISKEFFSMTEEQAIIYYKDLRKRYKASWYDAEWKTYYMKAVDSVWYEYLKVREKTRFTYHV
ncbi:MAG: hypothetical protein IKM20_02545 [Erysipelotrichales bacterium]|nr:hypothetical protein [Erysipelotrichales bacterium]